QGLHATGLLEFRQALALEAAGDTPAPEARALRLRVIRALEDRGLWDEAAAEARRGLEREPDSEPLRLALAEAEVRGGDGAAARAGAGRGRLPGPAGVPERGRGVPRGPRERLGRSRPRCRARRPVRRERQLRRSRRRPRRAPPRHRPARCPEEPMTVWEGVG